MKAPVFDSPQWIFKSTDASTTIAGLCGDIRVFRKDKQIKVFHTVPPSGFFKFAREVLKAESLQDWRFYVDIEGERGKTFKYVLGIECTGNNLFYDLWHYTPSTLPAWLKL